MHESEQLNGLRDSNNFDKYSPRNSIEKEIVEVCNQVKELIISKNRAYGNSALDPIRIFSKTNNKEQILVRIDDKLNRFFKGTEFPGDNDIDDLIGYLVLLKISKNDNWR